MDVKVQRSVHFNSTKIARKKGKTECGNKKLNEMTRSAPPERNMQMKALSETGRHTAYDRPTKPKSKRETSAISVEDIYSFAERERLAYSSTCRRQNLVHAQSQAHFFQHEQSVVPSRPNTSASRHIHSAKREHDTPMSAWSEPVMSRPSSIVPPQDLRELLVNGGGIGDTDEEEEADDDDDYYGYNMAHHTPMSITFSPVGRDCCEVIGPQLCYECRKNRIRAVNRQRTDHCFPVLEPSEEHLTTAAIVRKYLPGLSEPEIETKLARGEIAKPSMLRKNNRQVEFDDEETGPKPRNTNKKVTIVENSGEGKNENNKITPKKVSELFFTNIRDLNSKIISGNVERNIGFSEAARKVTKQKEKLSLKTHFPTFVSPRKVTMVQQTNYKTYFEPPLIEKAKQDVEPAFFAGSTNEYVLPEKLPDELVFIDKDGNEVKASSSQGFTDKLSASAELTGSKGKRDKLKSVKENGIAGKENLGCLAEDEEEVEDERLNLDDDSSDLGNLDSTNSNDEDDEDDNTKMSDQKESDKDNKSCDSVENKDQHY